MTAARCVACVACVAALVALATAGCGTSVGKGSIDIVPRLRAPRSELAGAKCLVLRPVDVSKAQLDGKPLAADHPIVVGYMKTFTEGFPSVSRIPVVAPEKAAGCGALQIALEVWDLRSGKEESASAHRRYDAMLASGRPDNNASVPPGLQFQTSMAQTQLAGLSLALARSNYDADTVLRVKSADDRPLADIVLNTRVSTSLYTDPVDAFASAAAQGANTYALTVDSLVAP